MTYYLHNKKLFEIYLMPPDMINRDWRSEGTTEQDWQNFHTYLSTLTPIPHELTGEGVVALDRDFKWDLRGVGDPLYGSTGQPSYKAWQRVAVPIEAKEQVVTAPQQTDEEAPPPPSQQPVEKDKKPTEGDQDLVVDFMARFIKEAALLIEGRFITGFENVFSVEGRSFTLSLIPINTNRQFDVSALFETEGWENVKSILYDRDKHEWVVSYKNNLPENRFGLFRDTYLFLHSESNQI